MLASREPVATAKAWIRQQHTSVKRAGTELPVVRVVKMSGNGGGNEVLCS